ncbi:hypothetical protein [Winogradskya humida]|uniref:Uncharacterized protein n=1 Tax=Winogradskya humida TaxID=113566 RepID=A0ABQ3ZIA8_9ACTN|nr:hypothetical protein [Actinoplanes humidus]GIE18321.1 hypothetical protein Ahu01nite_014230 [Actinoplanes humidus]
MPDDGRTTGRQPQPGGGYNYRAGGRRNAVPPELLEARSKRHSEWLLPAAVILAGVLVVVAVGFIVSRSIRNDEPAAVAPVQPPALGEFPATPGNQFPIPLASDSPSPSPSPSVSATPSPSRTTQPSRKERPSEFPGSVSIARTGIPQIVDLTAEGNRDWVHWGEQSTFSLERKSDGAFQILEGAPTAPRFRHGLSPQRFSWTGGSPVDHSDGTPTGIRTCDKGNGFTISAPATTSTRTLKIYAGARAARGKLTAKLSVGGASATSTFTEQSNNLATTAFVITYKAPKNGKINLSWITDASFDDDCGGVALEAATLR